MRGSCVIWIVGLGVLLSACGKGVDAKLTTSNEQAYRVSLNAAWQDMTANQQNAYNWAVSNFTVDQLIAKYPSMTPRTVIEREADDYIKVKTQEVAAIAADLAKNADRLAQEEKMVRDVDVELAKISATGVDINNSWGFGKEFVFITKNDSQFDISSADWDAWLFINGEEKSDRHCKVSAYYKTHGGLPRGGSIQSSFGVGFTNCNNWDTLEVKKAKSKQFKLELDRDSVENFAEKKVRPQFSTTRATYENEIKAAKSEIESAMTAKAALK